MEENPTVSAFPTEREQTGPGDWAANHPVDGAPASVERWRSYLAEFSADMLRAMDEDELDITDEQRAASWLGYDGATEEQITALEERLGTQLPPSYRSFLATSNGWGPLGSFLDSMRSTGAVCWVDDLEGESGPLTEADLVNDGLAGRVLLISLEGDALYWLLDAGDISPDGEWAAYIWASWYPGLGERFRSFADLVADERGAFEELSGAEGNPVHPDGAEELLAEGRRSALRGEVEEALDTFQRAADKGSGAAAYLRVVLSAFLDLRRIFHDLRGVLHHPHVASGIGIEQLSSEAVPLFMRSAEHDGIDPRGEAARVLAGIVPGLPTGSALQQEWDTWLADHPLPEPPAFEQALETARELAARGATDEAWTVIARALPEWYPMSPNRIAPVVLLTDPTLRPVIDHRRAREVVFTPRCERAPI
ncbi:hypothetical protein F4561_000489 [Lipingzhangella halophila]|uniref:Knr4/Smi1-like domain-containing protein n=1 Tax=Lipingzhangella halophila TaxID=1783352 RepID=A0A7W7W1E3_9ACTN|nr:SMI1/KNR4 family protein [Lipingzhangella halophila]MBB4929669.1 hypothetical protein [Lipingzhangella halophila]